LIETDDELGGFNLHVVHQLKIAVQKGLILQEIGFSPGGCLRYRLIVERVERVADHVNMTESSSWRAQTQVFPMEG
jgi:hypothetical protein